MGVSVRRDPHTRGGCDKLLRSKSPKVSKNTYRKRFLIDVRLDIVSGVLVLLFFADIGNHFQSFGWPTHRVVLLRAREFI